MSFSQSIVEASIEDLSSALSLGKLTSVDLVAKYLLRISTYDCRNMALNSVPLINEKVFEEAATADDRRLAGHTLGNLDGLPFTVKDSYKVKGMTVASGSEAFQNLVANEDAFTVQALRDAGAVLLGKTNMCPMAYGGMIRGLYGRAESPYNADYLAAAFGSGSSNGSGVSVSASFAAFGMGEETVSSGRSPASNNALVAYTPSRGLISIRGNWPLYPTCDVVVPHTRSVDDLLALMDVLLTQDSKTTGDFWRDQPFMDISKTLDNVTRPFNAHKEKVFLRGKRIAVPQNFITRCEDGPFVSEDVKILWNQTKSELEALGVIIEVVPELLFLKAYQESIKNRIQSASDEVSKSSPQLPVDWNLTERGPLIAHAWEDFLSNNADTNYPSLTDIDPIKIFPHLPRTDPQAKFTEPANAIKWEQLAIHVSDRNPSTSDRSPMYCVPRLPEAVKALEAMRKAYFEEWLDENRYDLVVFPAAGDVAKSDADIDFDSAKHAWTDGVVYSHGNRALRHLGIPSITVPMGILRNSRMPMGLTIIGRAYDDLNIVKAGWAFEHNARKREIPSRTPILSSDMIADRQHITGLRPKLNVPSCSVSNGTAHLNIKIEGSLTLNHGSQEIETSKEAIVEVYVDGNQIPVEQIKIQQFEEGSASFKFDVNCHADRSPPPDSRNAVVGKIARDSTIIIILARQGETGRSSGFLKIVHSSDVQA